MSVEVVDESGFTDPAGTGGPGVSVDEISELARFVLGEMHVHPGADLSVILVDTTAMTALHVQWMDEPGPTDVLSFPMDELRPGSEDDPTPAGLLGDVVVCPEVAAQQARESGHSTAEEVLLLVTHGILHLLGFDHAEPDEEREMFALQRRLLLTFLARRRQPS
ncbi:probable rRNA maturation factor [Quadrisphaera granulorum]|uniref:Endoribonuclease YbeY n=1 Tax=Quadrisphaera granulorum TaxID=317664 RepID=A0A316A7Z2_9ACTN|nr:rRNA maturation RNase YbeY [Quadrisphaera granulorum]PWJ54036.1 putative rRNA maturation factor [Quadrisphaera granulorum]SZE96493.1 probable rRNA maturation factor [Quadrisphaera granulorum]